MSVLSPEQIAQYQQDGYTILRNALSAEDLSTLRSHIEGIASGALPFPEANIEFDPNAPQQRHIDHLRKINGPSDCDPFFRDHAAREPLLTAAADLLGPDLKLFGDQVFIKGPGGLEKIYPIPRKIRVHAPRYDEPLPPLGLPRSDVPLKRRLLVGRGGTPTARDLIAQ